MPGRRKGHLVPPFLDWLRILVDIPGGQLWRRHGGHWCCSGRRIIHCWCLGSRGSGFSFLDACKHEAIILFIVVCLSRSARVRSLSCIATYPSFSSLLLVHSPSCSRRSSCLRRSSTFHCRSCRSSRAALHPSLAAAHLVYAAPAAPPTSISSAKGGAQLECSLMRCWLSQSFVTVSRQGSNRSVLRIRSPVIHNNELRTSEWRLRGSKGRDGAGFVERAAGGRTRHSAKSSKRGDAAKVNNANCFRRAKSRRNFASFSRFTPKK